MCKNFHHHKHDTFTDCSPITLQERLGLKTRCNGCGSNGLMVFSFCGVKGSVFQCRHPAEAASSIRPVTRAEDADHLPSGPVCDAARPDSHVCVFDLHQSTPHHHEHIQLLNDLLKMQNVFYLITST